MEYFPKKKRPRLIADFDLDHTDVWRGTIKHNDNDWRFQNYKGNKLGYDMLCESVNSEQEENEGNLLNGNRIINLYNLIPNIDKVLVGKEFSQERELQIKLEEKRDVENFIDYVHAYF